MPSTIDRSIWTLHPESVDHLKRLVDLGMTNREISGELVNAFGVHVSEDGVRRKRKLLNLPAPRAVTAPPEGYAKPLPVAQKSAQEWTPRVEEHGDGTATAVSRILESPNPEHDDLIRGWNLDPQFWRISGPLSCNRWPSQLPVFAEGKCVGYEEKWNYQYKARLVERSANVVDLAALIEEIRTHEPAASRPAGKGAFVVALADPQMGKADGDGSKGIVDRILDRIDAVPDRVRHLRSLGFELGTLYLFGMGDLIENCDGHYAQQAWRTEWNRRDQVGAMRWLLVKALKTWAPMFDRVIVSCVGGNHGENRKDGKSFTDFADNDDVAIFDQVAAVLAENPEAYGHVSFRIPKDDLSLTFDVDGVVVGIAHGHQAGKGNGGFAQQKLINWWMKQAHGQQPVGDAEMLISAHFHHFSVVESGTKVHIQCPALDGGSDWFRNLSGQDSRPGLLTLVVGKNITPERNYTAVEVL